MTTLRPRTVANIVAGLCLAAIPAAAAWAQTPSPSPPAAQKGAALSGRAQGAFDVKMTPGPEDKESGVGRMTADKQYHGDLEGTGKGEMLSFLSAVKGSAVYVAIERVSGTLRGRTGTLSDIPLSISTGAVTSIGGGGASASLRAGVGNAAASVPANDVAV